MKLPKYEKFFVQLQDLLDSPTLIDTSVFSPQIHSDDGTSINIFDIEKFVKNKSELGAAFEYVIGYTNEMYKAINGNENVLMLPAVLAELERLSDIIISKKRGIKKLCQGLNFKIAKYKSTESTKFVKEIKSLHEHSHNYFSNYLQAYNKLLSACQQKKVIPNDEIYKNIFDSTIEIDGADRHLLAYAFYHGILNGPIQIIENDAGFAKALKIFYSTTNDANFPYSYDVKHIDLVVYHQNFKHELELIPVFVRKRNL